MSKIFEYVVRIGVRYSSLLLSIAILWGSQLLTAAPPIGIIKTLQGDASILRESAAQPCQEGFHLLEGDTIRTAPGARVGIILIDGTRLAIGEKAELKINKFLFEPSETKYGLALQVIKGVVAYFSGKIARFAPQSVELHTPVGIIGTRGTALAMKIDLVAP